MPKGCFSAKEQQRRLHRGTQDGLIHEALVAGPPPSLITSALSPGSWSSRDMAQILDLWGVRATEPQDKTHHEGIKGGRGKNYIFGGGRQPPKSSSENHSPRVATNV